MPDGLATTTASVQLSNAQGRAIASVRTHRWVVDSPPPLGGPNEEANPLDLLLVALGTCGIFVCETAARERGLVLRSATAAVEADFDPRGVKGEDVDPKIQAFRVTFVLGGIASDQADALVEAFRKRCPVYTTLVAATPIEIRTVVED